MSELSNAGKPLRDFKVVNGWGEYFLVGQSKRGKELLEYRWIPESFTQPRVKPSLTIMHSNAGGTSTTLDSIWRWYARDTVTGEPTFQVMMDGKIAHIMPLARRADTSYKANSWWEGSDLRGAMTFETADKGAATLETTNWSLAQFETIAQAIAAVNVYAYEHPELGWRMECHAPAHYRDAGIGYHSQFPEWSIYKGKSCPGRARILTMDALRNRVATIFLEYGDN